MRRGESTSVTTVTKPENKKNTAARTNAITSVTTSLADLLHSSDSEDGLVNSIRIEDKGSRSRKVIVNLHGLPVQGVIDSGADITIMNGDTFKKVAAIARLRKKAFKSADKIPYGYDNKPFKLDGCIDLDVTFAEYTMCTTVYLKMDAHDSLLLSEGVCHQLGIISYHPNVEASPSTSSTPTTAESNVPVGSVSVVRVHLVKSTRLLPLQSKMVAVNLQQDHGLSGTILIEPSSDNSTDLLLGCCIVNLTEDTPFQVLLTNPTGFTQQVGKGSWSALACEVTPIHASMLPHDPATVKHVNSADSVDAEHRQQLMSKILFQDSDSSLTRKEKDQLKNFLLANHDAFALMEGERGETDQIQMQIDTGSSLPLYQPARRTPFAAREEIARQLHQMQQQGVISPSTSPWASPVVLVRKKDGSLRFCIDFRKLNAITKPDVFPLPRIDDLSDQLGKSRYFSTLDLAAGYWQVQMHSSSKEKTAFITHKDSMNLMSCHLACGTRRQYFNA